MNYARAMVLGLFTGSMLTACGGGGSSTPVPPTALSSRPMTERLYVATRGPLPEVVGQLMSLPEIDVYNSPYNLAQPPAVILQPFASSNPCSLSLPLGQPQILAVDKAGRIAVTVSCGSTAPSGLAIAIINPPLSANSRASIIIPLSPTTALGFPSINDNPGASVSTFAFDPAQNLWLGVSNNSSNALVEISYPQTATSQASTINRFGFGTNVIDSIAFDSSGEMYVQTTSPTALYLYAPPYSQPPQLINVTTASSSFASSNLSPIIGNGDISIPSSGGITVTADGTLLFAHNQSPPPLIPVANINVFPSIASFALPAGPASSATATPDPTTSSSPSAVPPQPPPPPAPPVQDQYALATVGLIHVPPPGANGLILGVAADNSGAAFVLVAAPTGEQNLLNIFPGPITMNEQPTVIACPTGSAPNAARCNASITGFAVGP